MEIVRVCPTECVMNLIEVDDEMREGVRTSRPQPERQIRSKCLSLRQLRNPNAQRRQEFDGSTGLCSLPETSDI
jgi:hypothetical protein